MGTWGTGIYSNDTAHDLRSEYTAAFWFYEKPTALRKIDSYVRRRFNESDEEEWCNYCYSLADFMWKKGILTEDIRDRAVQMIDTGFGLALWQEAGDRSLRERQKVLEKFRAKLLSPQPPEKRIRPNVHTENVFADGDVIAVRLRTRGKPYTCADICPLSQADFEALDGKYVLIQKVCTHVSWHSDLVPEVADHWLIFRLFDGIYDTLPAVTDAAGLKPLPVWRSSTSCSQSFISESSPLYFKRRSSTVLANDAASVAEWPQGHGNADVYFGIDKPFYNADSRLAAALMIGKHDTERI